MLTGMEAIDLAYSPNLKMLAPLLEIMAAREFAVLKDRLYVLEVLQSKVPGFKPCLFFIKGSLSSLLYKWVCSTTCQGNLTNWQVTGCKALASDPVRACIFSSAPDGFIMNYKTRS